MDQLVNSIYAKSLFEVSKEENCIEEVKTTFDAFVKAVHENKAYISLLALPTIPMSEKHRMTDEFKLNSIFSNFLRVLIEKNRIDSLFGIKIEFDSLYNMHHGIGIGVVYTSHTIPEKVFENLTKTLEKSFGKKLKLNQVVDANLIGGFRVEVDGKVIDSTVKNKLEELRLSLNEMSN